MMAGDRINHTDVDRLPELTIFRCLAKYRLVNRVFKALADPTRRRVLQLLRERPMSAGELADHFPVAKPTMSAHFAVLCDADLVEAEKTGRTITYRIKMSVLEDALLGFAHTVGWNIPAPDHARRPSVAARRRPLKGEA
jgi:DNA-binding transcriptional ArsR family regulator